MPCPETTLAASHHESHHDLVFAELKKKDNEKFPRLSTSITWYSLNGLSTDPRYSWRLTKVFMETSIKAFNPKHHWMRFDISKERRRNEYAGGGYREADPILSLRGLGKELWANEDADAYVERLREGWE